MRFIFKILNFFLTIFLIFILIIGSFGYISYREVIKKTPVTVKVEEIRSKDNYVKFEDISTYFLDYLVNIEDSKFYKHSGIDIFAIFGAIIANLEKGYLKYGGSTITQQLAKNMYLSSDKKIIRKISEMFLSFNFERNYTKEEILELYVNIIYFGNGYYGINEASYGYFNVAPKYLNSYQSTLLVGVPQAPSMYNINDRNKEFIRRHNEVLNLLFKDGFITKNQLEEFKGN